MVSQEDRLKLFINELNEISEENLRKFAEELIVNADDYFFTIAASTTGKYHPKFDLGTGGLVRHTRCVVFFAICEATSRCFSDHEKNMLIVSALAHDIKKLGDGKGKYTVPDHPKWAAEYIKDTNKRTMLLSSDDENTIGNIVYSHMGKWGAQDGMPMPQTDLEKALQAADYIASRKEILDFDFKPTEQVVIVEEKKGPGDFYIDFGKKSGKTIKEVYEEEKSNLSGGYLMWMINMENFNKADARIAAIEYLNEVGALPDKFKSELKKEQQEVTPSVKENVEFKTSDESDDLPF